MPATARTMQLQASTVQAGPTPLPVQCMEALHSRLCRLEEFFEVTPQADTGGDVPTYQVAGVHAGDYGRLCWFNLYHEDEGYSLRHEWETNDEACFSFQFSTATDSSTEMYGVDVERLHAGEGLECAVFDVCWFWVFTSTADADGKTGFTVQISRPGETVEAVRAAFSAAEPDLVLGQEIECFPGLILQLPGEVKTYIVKEEGGNEEYDTTLQEAVLAKIPSDDPDEEKDDVMSSDDASRTEYEL